MRAQLALDWLLMLGLVLIIFLALLSVYLDKRDYYRETNSKLASLAAAQRFAWVFDSVLAAGNGTSYNLTLPHTLDTGETYSIRLVSNRIEIISRVNASYPLASSATGTTTFFPNATIQLTNVNGGILIG